MRDWFGAIEAAAERIRPHVRQTPVDPSAELSRLGGAEVFLKMENLQVTGSFKLRGAMNRLSLLSPDERRRGIVAASSGNHGMAVSWGMKALGGKATVFVPENASPVKLQAMRDHGAEVRARGTDSGVSELEARRYADEQGLAYVSPYNDPEVVTGQGTTGLEIGRQVDAPDAVFVALGGGGLIAGIGLALEGLGRRIEMVACSPENSAVMHHSLAAGRILEMESLPTLSDGTAGGVEPGAITFELCRRLVTRSVTVTEGDIRASMRLVLERHHTLIEGAAAVAVAGYLKEKERFRGRRVVIVLCGANISLERLREAIA
ncbi:MAG TPA: threonine/serine dehydratase [Candidatus Polarisedimenticolia bacterium]|jgi:threonine dehydratase|nr:threonine/serine dehydratase [Candidatus Polarisedimenticolia bacterium]